VAHKQASRLTKTGRVTVPGKVRTHLGVQAGDRLAWEITADGTVTVSTVREPENPFTVFLGVAPLPEGWSTETLMTELRGERHPQLQSGPGPRIVSLKEFLERR